MAHTRRFAGRWDAGGGSGEVSSPQLKLGIHLRIIILGGWPLVSEPGVGKVNRDGISVCLKKWGWGCEGCGGGGDGEGCVESEWVTKVGDADSRLV